MKLSVIIVSYNVKHYLSQCLVSLAKSLCGIDAEVLVVDNCSSDGSADYISSKHAWVKVIRSSRNLGFAKANNVAINQSTGEYVLLLNPDTIVAEGTMGDVLSFMDEHEKAAGVGVRMMSPSGVDAMESRRGLPTPMTAFYKIVGLCARFPKSKRFAHYYMGGISWDEAARIEVVSGAFFMLRRKALERVGLLDEDYFMYGEDIDLSFRLLKAGYENWYVPSRILHYKGESTEKSSFRYVHVFYSAMLIFFRKHYGNSSFLITVPVKLAIYFKAFAALLKTTVQNVRSGLALAPTRHSSPNDLFLFIGSSESIAYQEQLARNNDLRYLSLEGDETTRPDGHLSIDLSAEEHVCAVYDTEAYSYSSILKLLSRSAGKNVTLGTFNMDTKKIVLSKGIIM